MLFLKSNLSSKRQYFVFLLLRLFRNLASKPTMMKRFVLAFVLPLVFAYTVDRTCPENKDPECMEGQIMCPGTISDWTGCPFPDYCIDQYSKYSKDLDGNPCPNSCNVECSWRDGESYCSDPPINGCFNVGGFCWPKFSENCLALCPITCNDGEIVCSGGMDFQGCPFPSYCQAPYGDCPAVCSVISNCNYHIGEQYCDYGLDSNGCWLGGYCSEPFTECADPTVKYPFL